MDNMEEIMQAISIVFVVGVFLCNTGRGIKAIELFKEGLVLLNNKALEKEKHLSNYFFKHIYFAIFKTYDCNHDYKTAAQYGRKLLVILRQCGETVNEGMISLALEKGYRIKNKPPEAKELYETAIDIMNKTGNRKEEAVACRGVADVFFQSLFDYEKAKEYYDKALEVNIEIGDRKGEATAYGNLGNVFHSLAEDDKAREYYDKALEIEIEIGDRQGEATTYGNLGNVFHSHAEYDKAKEYFEKALEIEIEIGDRLGEADAYVNLGNVFQSLAEYDKAKEYYDKALSISIETGDRQGEANAYGNLGNVFRRLAEYGKAKEYYEKALEIEIEIGDRQGEATAYGNLGNVFHSLAEYDKAKEYFEKALEIAIEIGDRLGEANAHVNLGNVFICLAEYDKAKEYYDKTLSTNIEIGDRQGVATAYLNLGNVFHSHAEYDKAKEYYEKALEIKIEIRDREGEATAYVNLGNVFQSLAEYDKAKEYYEKSHAIKTEIGDRQGEANLYGNLGNVFESLAEYDKAKEYYDKALEINIEIGDRRGEASAYENLGKVFHSLAEYDKAKEYYDKALEINIEIGCRQGEVQTYGILGHLSINRGKYSEANENIRKALALASEIGDRVVEAKCYHSLGLLFEEIGDSVKAKEHVQKALTLLMEIGNRGGEAACYANLGSLYISHGENVKGEEYLAKAISMSTNIGALEMEWMCYKNLALAKVSAEKSREAFPFLFKSVEISEVCRGFLKDNDEFKILYSDMTMSSLKLLSKLFCDAGSPKKALFAEELGRARALSELMAAQYSVESQISADPQSWNDTANFVNLESDCTCLYISYIDQNLLLWILKASGDIQYRTLTVDKKTLQAQLATNLDEYFANIAQSFRSFGVLPEEKCEDRSLDGTESKLDSSHQENVPVLREAKNEVDPKPSLTLFYQMIIAPVANLLETPEIIIVPERSLFRVPFPALLDEKGKYLSESFRIRIVPSLTSLKLIQNSPADYHNQTGALIVGEPDVGKVILKDKCETFTPLPCARNEAEMIGQWLGVKPLLGKHATKQAVLQRIHSVSLVHLAAHGDAERGEIALAPERTGRGIPQEKDYLLTMSDISKVQVRAKLVVLSCCHSALGQLRAEGVIGIARAFLGSGARSVLVSLWALEDSATKYFMRRFYKNLMCGKSASESLHQAMKWMRDHGFSDVSEWAPFLLIGDDVTFVFENVSTVIEMHGNDGISFSVKYSYV